MHHQLDPIISMIGFYGIFNRRPLALLLFCFLLIVSFCFMIVHLILIGLPSVKTRWGDEFYFVLAIFQIIGKSFFFFVLLLLLVGLLDSTLVTFPQFSCSSAASCSIPFWMKWTTMTSHLPERKATLLNTNPETLSPLLVLLTNRHPNAHLRHSP
jgi:hypothetical protein